MQPNRGILDIAKPYNALRLAESVERGFPIAYHLRRMLWVQASDMHADDEKSEAIACVMRFWPAMEPDQDIQTYQSSVLKVLSIHAAVYCTCQPSMSSWCLQSSYTMTYLGRSRTLDFHDRPRFVKHLSTLEHPILIVCTLQHKIHHATFWIFFTTG